MRLYFARHGESEANVQQVFWNKPHGYGLTGKGQEQAQALADSLAGIPFVALYCSPVLRAVQAAQIVGQRLGLTPEVAEGLWEYDVGILEGAKYSKEREAIYWQVVQQWMEHDHHEARIEGGESYNDIAARFMPLIARLEERYRDTEANLLLISHGGTLRAMLPLLLSNVDKPFSMARPIGYTVAVVAEQRDGEWVCLRWGEENL
ncbi:MAG: histidine phosphatase family protein [Anaerolineae bacterium]|nr:histidine phosphatase family protein [Anaerolineae bacterium]